MYFLLLLTGLLFYILRNYIYYHADQPRTYTISRKKEQKINYFTEHTFDENSNEYYDILVKVLVLCTYDAEKFRTNVSEDFPFRRLEEDIEFVFTEEIFKTILRNKLIGAATVPRLLQFKEAVSKITEDEWFFEKVDLNLDERWKEIGKIAKNLLNDMKIEN